MARKRKSGVTARPDSEARDVKDDRDSDEPIALREDAEECDEGARAADLDEHALLLEELAQLRRALEKRESDFAAIMVAQQRQAEAMLHGVVNRFALALSAQKVGPNPECEDGAEVRIQSPDNSPGGVISVERVSDGEVSFETPACDHYDDGYDGWHDAGDAEPVPREDFREFDMYGYAKEADDDEKTPWRRGSRYGEQSWRVVGRCWTKKDAMQAVKKMFGSKRVAGLNNGKTAYYTCGEHVGCECRYRVTFSTKNNAWLVAKQKYMDHERGELPRVEPIEKTAELIPIDGVGDANSNGVKKARSTRSGIARGISDEMKKDVCRLFDMHGYGGGKLLSFLKSLHPTLELTDFPTARQITVRSEISSVCCSEL